MGQLNHSILQSSTQHGYDDYSASMMDGIYHAKAAWKRLAKEPVHSPIYRGAWNEKSIWQSWDGHEVETLIGELRAEEALRQSQEELRQLSLQLLTIQEWERQRIAADLHDGLGQSLSLIKLSMESVIKQVNAGAHREAAASLNLMIHKVKDTMAELHRTIMDLRPSMLDDLGLMPTLTWFFREFGMAWRDKKVEKDLAISESEVPIPLKTPIFRILQEAVNNVVKHAHADLIRVSLKRIDGDIRLSIEDNGDGFDPAAVSIRRGCDRGFGLLTMRERARSSDGIFEMKSTPGGGTQIYISWRPTEGAVSHSAVEAQNAPD